MLLAVVAALLFGAVEAGPTAPAFAQALLQATGADQPSADQADPDRTGADQTSSDQSSSDQAGADQTSADQSDADQAVLDQATPLGAGPGDAGADADLIPAPPSPTVAQLSNWAVASGDNQDMPFLIVDKLAAEVFVYDAEGHPLGAAPALIGIAFGDDSAPGVGDRELSQIPMEDRTTPAGRFVANLGPSKGEGIVLWVDFETAVSLHPVLTSQPRERRLERIRSPSPDDHRITHGCINVPAKFYKDVIRTTFADTKGVVYILPDTKPLEDVFPNAALAEAAYTSRRAQARRVADIGEILATDPQASSADEGVSPAGAAAFALAEPGEGTASSEPPQAVTDPELKPQNPDLPSPVKAHRAKGRLHRQHASLDPQATGADAAVSPAGAAAFALADPGEGPPSSEPPQTAAAGPQPVKAHHTKGQLHRHHASLDPQASGADKAVSPAGAAAFALADPGEGPSSSEPPQTAAANTALNPPGPRLPQSAKAHRAKGRLHRHPASLDPLASGAYEAVNLQGADAFAPAAPGEAPPSSEPPQTAAADPEPKPQGPDPAQSAKAHRATGRLHRRHAPIPAPAAPAPQVDDTVALQR
jgi:hypothetical protein